jgi:hypothetical protein
VTDSVESIWQSGSDKPPAKLYPDHDAFSTTMNVSDVSAHHGRADVATIHRDEPDPMTDETTLATGGR